MAKGARTLPNALHVAEVQPGMLAVARAGVERLGYRTVCPTVMERRPIRERARRAPWLPKLRQRELDVEVPMFPGYLLVELDTDEDGWERVEYTKGVAGLIKGAGTDLPARVPEAAARELERRCEAGPAPDDGWSKSFAPGAFVRVAEGPLATLTGAVQRADAARRRVWVLLSILGRSGPVELDGCALEAM